MVNSVLESIFLWWSNALAAPDKSTLSRIVLQVVSELFVRVLHQKVSHLRDNQAQSLLILAARYLSKQHFLRVLANSPPEDLSRCNTEGFTVLHFACEHADTAWCLAVLQRAKLAQQQALVNFASFNGQWTPIHVAATSGHQDVITLLRRHGGNPRSVDIKGHTPLMIACARNHVDAVNALLAPAPEPLNGSLQNNASTNDKVGQSEADVLAPLLRASDSKCRNVFHLCAISGALECAKLLLQTLDNMPSTVVDHPLHARDSSGYTPLHAACVACRCPPQGSADAARQELQENALKIVEVLLARHDVDVNAKSNDGSSPLMSSLRSKNAHLFALLMTKKPSLTDTNTFGCNVLHECARCLLLPQTEEVLAAIESDGGDLGRHLLLAQDNDGLTPLHCACSELSVAPDDNPNISEAVTVVSKIAEKMCVLQFEIEDKPGKMTVGTNAMDYADMTAVHVLCFNPANRACVDALSALLQHGADATLEDHTGFTALHFLNMRSSPTALAMKQHLTDFLQKSNPAFLRAFDPSKKRNSASQKYLSRRGPHNRIPKDQRDAVLANDLTLQGFVNALLRQAATSTPPKVLVLTGAGISVSCGIPDFRSPDTGLLTTNKFQSAFSGMFEENKELFWNACKELFLPVIRGRFKPSYTHGLIKLLADKGWLLRNYTQNVDMLEHVAGIPNDKIVECHGTMGSIRCCNVACSFVVNAPAPLAADSPAKSIWNAVEQGRIPTCPKCHFESLRPDIVFFGEALPKRFHELKDADLRDCTALIVIGTSLKVFPFAGLVNSCGLLCPRLLINKELVGPWQQPLPEGVRYRDVARLGACDAGAFELAETLGWGADLEDLMENLTTASV